MFKSLQYMRSPVRDIKTIHAKCNVNLSVSCRVFVNKWPTTATDENVLSISAPDFPTSSHCFSWMTDSKQFLVWLLHWLVVPCIVVVSFNFLLSSDIFRAIHGDIMEPLYDTVKLACSWTHIREVVLWLDRCPKVWQRAFRAVIHPQVERM